MLHISKKTTSMSIRKNILATSSKLEHWGDFVLETQLTHLQL